jgi:hypothetical protein
MAWDRISTRMTEDVTITWDHISARITQNSTMTSDRTSLTTTYVIRRKEHLWNANALQRVHLPEEDKQLKSSFENNQNR